MTILGIETSCDETSAAIVRDGKLLSNVTATQFFHAKYGGVVPELASRAHQQRIVPIVQEALSQADLTKAELDGVAAVYGPGLVGSILVGLSFGKAMALGLGVPFIGVNHMEAHILSNLIEEPQPDFPFINLTVSGGHTQLVLVKNPFDYQILGETKDDAAGEAFDKEAKMLAAAKGLSTVLKDTFADLEIAASETTEGRETTTLKFKEKPPSRGSLRLRMKKEKV